MASWQTRLTVWHVLHLLESAFHSLLTISVYMCLFVSLTKPSEDCCVTPSLPVSLSQGVCSSLTYYACSKTEKFTFHPFFRSVKKKVKTRCRNKVILLFGYFWKFKPYWFLYTYHNNTRHNTNTTFFLLLRGYLRNNAFPNKFSLLFHCDK